MKNNIDTPSVKPDLKAVPPDVYTAFFQSFLHNPSLGFWVVDEDGRFLQVNDAYLRRAGYTRRELLGQPISIVEAPQAAAAKAALQQTTKQQGHHQFESVHRTKDGESWPVTVNATYENGRFFAIIQDITERKKTEEALRKSQAQLAGIFTSTIDAIISIDEDQKIIFFNAAAEQMFGYRADEITGQDHNILLPPRFRDVHRRHINSFSQSSQKQRKMGNIDALFGLRANGEEFPADISISRVEIDNNMFFTAIMRDITEQKAAETAVAELQDILAQAEKIAKIGSWKWDLATKDLTWSAEMYNLFGVDPANTELDLNQIIQERIHPDDIAAVEQANVKVLEEYSPNPLEYRIVLPDGAKRVVWAEGRLVRDETDHPTALVGYVQDITARKVAERAIRESEERFHSTLDNMLEGCQIIGFEWNYLYVNASAAKHGRTSIAELLGKTMMEAYTDIETTELFAILNRCMIERTPHVMENKFEYNDGTFAWFDLSIQPVPKGLFILSIDITERKAAEAALRQSEERFSKAFHISPAALSLTRADGTILDVNESYERLSGYSREELIDQDATVLNLFTTEQRADLHRRMHAGGGRLREAELTIRNKSGELRHVLYSVEAIEIKGEMCALTLAFDVTQHKQAEATIAELNQRMELILNSAGEGIYGADVDGRITFINPAMAAMLGREPEELHGQDAHATFHYAYPDGAPYPADACTIRTAVQLGEELHNQPDVFWHKEGAPIFVEYTTTPIYHAAEVIGSVTIVRDVTQRKKDAEQQAMLAEQLRQAQKMESIGRLAGGVAHDFNNQLAVIKLYGDLIFNKMHAQDPLIPKLAQIRQAADRAEALTRQLLAFSRKQVLKPVNLNLTDLVTNLEKMLGRLIGEDITLSTDLHARLWSVMADPGQIEQVIMNLVINARDAMPTGGMITLETRNIPSKAETSSLQQDMPEGHCVMLAITDTGHGMDEATRAQIFEPFFTTKQPGKGTGLGLATVHGIVKQSGGAITVDSEPNRGTTFKIYLPANQDAVTQQTTSAPTATAVGSETILLVEDETALRELIQETLAELGYTALAAANGVEALTIARETPIDLLLSDVVLPQMSGREIAEALTALQPQTKVLFISGYMDDAIMRHGVLADNVNFLSKPFTHNALTAKVREVLDKLV